MLQHYAHLKVAIKQAEQGAVQAGSQPCAPRCLGKQAAASRQRVTQLGIQLQADQG